LLEHPCTKAKFPFQLSSSPSSVSCLLTPCLPVSCLLSPFILWENSCDTNLMGLLSGLTVVGNLGYQKYYRPDLLVQLIQRCPSPCTTCHNSPKPMCKQGNDGDSQEIKLSGSPQFLLAHQTRSNTATAALQQTLKAARLSTYGW